MKTVAAAVAIGAVFGTPLSRPASVVTVAQADAHHLPLDNALVAISGDGRYVAFTSYARLAAADSDFQRDIYLFDRVTGRVTLESGDRTPELRPGDADHPSISDDGESLVYALLNRVILLDIRGQKGQVVAEGRDPVISGDARFVVFTSSATNLTADADANGANEDVYLFSVRTGQIRRVSLDPSGAQPAGRSVTPSLTSDGRYVAFSSIASSGTEKSASRVYVRDVELNTTKMIAVGWRPVIDSTGRHIAFVSPASNLVAGDRNEATDVFVADLQTGSIELVSRAVTGGTGNGASANPAISSGGRFVVFQSEASNLVCKPACKGADEDINLLWDVFVCDRLSRRITRVSQDPASGWLETSAGPAIDSSGRVIAFSSSHPVDPTDNAHDFDLFIRQSAER